VQVRGRFLLQSLRLFRLRPIDGFASGFRQLAPRGVRPLGCGSRLLPVAKSGVQRTQLAICRSDFAYCNFPVGPRLRGNPLGPGDRSPFLFP
jgi:hypothetical protein